MSNTNCLADVKCPKCGAEDRFSVFATCWADVTDGGIDDTEQFNWDSTSPTICMDCGHEATMGAFDPTCSGPSVPVAHVAFESVDEVEKFLNDTPRLSVLGGVREWLADYGRMYEQHEEVADGEGLIHDAADLFRKLIEEGRDGTL